MSSGLESVVWQGVGLPTIRPRIYKVETQNPEIHACFQVRWARFSSCGLPAPTEASVMRAYTALSEGLEVTF